MNRKLIGRIAIVSLMLGVSTIACTPGSQTHLASISDVPTTDKIAKREAARAQTMLAQRDGLNAVDAAEKAVAAMPMNAAYRELLGQAYLIAGRFVSAEASFRVSLTLTPDQPKTQFRLALAEIAEGRGQDAQASLRALDGSIPVADLGLALAMAGDRAAGIAKLTDLVRSGKSDARGRQNLALAMALDGRWREARAIAMQDTGPDRIDAQLQSWATLAQPQTGGLSQVSAMLGVRPASDPGMPTSLALVMPRPGEVDLAHQTADLLPALDRKETKVALAATMSPNDLASSVTVPLEAPASIKAMPADAPAAAVVMAAQSAAAPLPIAATPVLLRAEAAAPLLRAPKSPIRLALMIAKPAPQMTHVGFVVQLGAFKRAGAIQAAWSRASKMMPRLTTYSPVHAQFSFSGSAVVRLSVGGFTSHDDAAGLCQQIRTKGGQCFVRAVAGDAPVQWVRSESARRDG